MTFGFPHALIGTDDYGFDIPSNPGFVGKRSKNFECFESVSLEEIISEYDSSLALFRENNRHPEVRILEEGKRTWWELRAKIGEDRFKEELIVTLSLAFHSAFVSRKNTGKDFSNISAIQLRVAWASQHVLGNVI